MAKKGAGARRAKRKVVRKARHEGIKTLGEGDLLVGFFLVVAGWLMIVISTADLWLTISASTLIIAGLILVGFGISDFIRSFRK